MPPASLYDYFLQLRRDFIKSNDFHRYSKVKDSLFYKFCFLENNAPLTLEIKTKNLIPINASRVSRKKSV